MVKMYDFGADTSNVSANERRALAWPVAVWSCYIPESDAQELNILEHLILQLVDRRTAILALRCALYPALSRGDDTALFNGE